MSEMSTPSDGWWRGRWWDLPPLILHPFDRRLDASALSESLKLSAHLGGLGEPDLDTEPLLRGRYVEFHMLCLVGKDVMRWIAQCVDFAGRDAVLANVGIRQQSFADLLVNRTPPAVAARFESWGVTDYRRVLSRGIGANTVFPKPPDYGVVSAEFLKDYYSFADSLFACYQDLTPFTRLESGAFGLALFTSDEYLSKLGCGLPDEPA